MTKSPTAPDNREALVSILLAAFWKEFNCVGSPEILGAWNAAEHIPVMLGCHVDVMAIHSFVSPSSSFHFSFVHCNLGSCNCNGVLAKVMMTIDDSMSRHHWIHLGWAQQVQCELHVWCQQVPVSFVK